MQRTTNIQLKHIQAAETHAVRHPVLRKGLPKSSCVFDRDTHSETCHLGAFVDNKLVGVLTLLPNSTDVQLRGMAVLERYQANGIGRQLVAYAEKQVRSWGIDFMWMNARLIAIPFYQKCGYQKEGASFVLPYGGEHYKMIKTL